VSWEASTLAGSHDVYFGTVLADVEAASRTSAKGVLASQGQTGTTFDPPGRLVYGQTYYWRIDEVAGNTIYKVRSGSSPPSRTDTPSSRWPPRPLPRR